MIVLRWHHWGIAALVAVLAHLVVLYSLSTLARPPIAQPLNLSPLATTAITLRSMPQLTASTEAVPEPLSETAQPQMPPPLTSMPSLERSTPQLPNLQLPPVGSIALKIDTRLPTFAAPVAPAAPPIKTVYEQDEVDRVPAGLYQPPPDYPIQARRRQLTGLVQVRMLIDTQGQVTQLRIVQSTPAGVFDQVVRQALKRWKFEPGQVGGRNVATWVEVPIRFELTP